MQKRSVASVIILTLITFGIYAIIWHVKTKDEMVAEGADIPTAWLMIIPIANIYWYWKWCGGVDHVTNGKMSQPVAFLLSWLLTLIGMAIVQDSLNQAIARGLPQRLPQARIA
ncbi:MAG: DUF4234 domain-containing protein [Kofleriaceae bacterium]